MKINELLSELNACLDAKEWAKDKTWQEIFDTCHRGDWLLWLFFKTNPGDKRIFLAKGHCANTVRHLMKDERSIKAVDAAIAFGNGEITEEERQAASDSAYAAAAASDYASDSAYASAAAVYAAVYASDSAYASAAAARKKNQQETADICRKYLPIEIWNIKFDLVTA